ncbi:MAG: NADP-dependent malic enzyme, partial [Bacteroidia bacterium]|nr:NADP-dependent malic enzyme [Bacteroidia bacterium]
GGINLEDIKAPECFEIEAQLREALNIPIMHDDQHGTAIISGAALLNALILVKKEISKIKMVVNGAGASAMSCSKLFIALGVKKENLLMLDSKGTLRTSRTDLDKYKQFFANDTKIETLEEAMANADVFIGLSKGNILSQEMIKSMGSDPIVFAMANPDPEITYELAIAARPDIIFATGRSDYPNQVNNVLGFPFIFRGALDVRATTINEEMKLAAVHAIASLAHEAVPESVLSAYSETNVSFGRTYIIPKPIDPRLIEIVSPAVAKAAMDSGVAKHPILDWEKYALDLRSRMGLDNRFIRRIMSKARQQPMRVVFAEADNVKILKAAQIVKEDKVAIPILLGNIEKIKKLLEENKIELNDVTIIDPLQEDKMREEFGKSYFEKRQRKGTNYYESVKLMRDRNYYGNMMVEHGYADAFISGLTKNYPKTLKPSLSIIGIANNITKVAGMYIIMTKKGPYFFADTTVNIDPTSSELVEITRMTHEAVKQFNVQPNIALLSYSNFGSSKGEVPEKMANAVAYLHKNHPEITVDGDIQANFAINKEMLAENFPFSSLVNKDVNTFIFPNLASGNIAYKFAQSFGAAESMGPILLGFKKSIHILQLGSSVREIVNMVSVAVVDAQTKSKV